MEKSSYKVIALYICDPETSVCSEKTTLTLDEKGIQNDKHYDKERNRSVLITSTYAYELARSEGITIEHGALGENILTDFDLRDIKPGEQLQTGDVILEIAQNCTLCNHLSKIDKKLPKLLRHDRGVFAKVVKGGELRQNDEVRKIK
jgi:MOSC domain-containing protein YiiM